MALFGNYGGRDRPVELLEISGSPRPLPPLNLSIIAWTRPGQLDITWTDPSELAENARFSLVGVNLYRSFDSEFGPFERLTPYPIGSGFWRDSTTNVLELEERVEARSWLMKGPETSGVYSPRYVFKTERKPIVKAGSQALPADHPSDVQVLIDGVEAQILRVLGSAGEVEIDGNYYEDVEKQSRFTPVLPTEPSIVTVTYRYNRTYVPTDLNQRVFYRATTVGFLDSNPDKILETALDDATAISRHDGEKLDYIWAEAIRRNAWILSQGGERVKLFVRKRVGEPCRCYRADYKEPLGDCTVCFGTGVLYGYEGPYDVVLAPDDAERTVERSVNGTTVLHNYEVWTGPKPMLTQRDFIVKLSGERYSIGPVRMVSSRGVGLQQHFQIGRIEENDIRYRVPIDNPRRYVEGQLLTYIPSNLNPSLPFTDKPGIPDERELRGRTVTYENITY